MESARTRECCPSRPFKARSRTGPSDSGRQGFVLLPSSQKDRKDESHKSNRGSPEVSEVFLDFNVLPIEGTVHQSFGQGNARIPRPEKRSVLKNNV
jgi:hypothetical protein